MSFKKNHRNLILLISLTISLSFLHSAYAFQGGPDKYGYRYIDSMERTGPKFIWQKFGKDVVQLEGKTAVGDNLTVSYPIGFPFEFYGKKYSSFQISDNGYIIFYVSRPIAASQGFTYNGEKVPSSAYPNGILAPLWGDNSGVA